MVTRVSTAGNYSAILANLMAAESRQVDAENRVSRQKNGSNLQDYANKAETLTAMKQVDRRLQAYQDQNSGIASKLTTQDQALTSIADSAQAVRQATADQFQIGVNNLNAKFDGKYLFAGGKVTTQPVTATSLASLTAGPPISS